MLTVQEIQAMSFEKAVFGGYDMKSVDEFLEQITEDYAAEQKENAALKSKMKVLVDKIEEYRSVEDGMRRALVSAQSIAQETIDKAKADAEALLSTTRQECERELAAHREKLEAEEKRLDQARQESAEFISKMTAFFEKQVRDLVALSASEVLQDEKLNALAPKSGTGMAVEAPTARVITEPYRAVQPEKPPVQEYTIPEDIRKFMEQQSNTKGVEEGGMKIKMMEVTLNDNGQDDNDNTRPKYEFGDLKFGAEYSPENDK